MNMRDLKALKLHPTHPTAALNGNDTNGAVNGMAMDGNVDGIDDKAKASFKGLEKLRWLPLTYPIHFVNDGSQYLIDGPAARPHHLGGESRCEGIGLSGGGCVL